MSSKSRNYAKKQWYKDLRDSNPDCIYCGDTLDYSTFTVDHIKARVDGGKDSPENCKPCCKFCNSLKDRMSYETFIEKYPKDKILKLKKYTDSSRQLCETDVSQGILDKLSQAYELIESIQDEYNQNKDMLNLYSNLKNEIINDIALDSNKNVTDGYKQYVKIREIERNMKRIKGEQSVLHSFVDSYKKTKIKGQLSQLMAKMKSKCKSTTGKRYKPLIEDDVRKAIEAKIFGEED